MRYATWIPVAAFLGLALALPSGLPSARADAKANRSDVMSVEDVKPGMKGYGLTVFEGTEPGKFDVEIIDVLKNFRPKQDLILVKTFHPRLEAAKVVAGMSGSPIYLDGKMIGAYAYGWSFGAEPIAGVTPIRNMLDDLARPLPEFINGWPLGKRKKSDKVATAPVGGPNRFAGDPGHYNLDEHVAQLKQRGVPGALSGELAGLSASPTDGVPVTTLTPVSTPLLLGGLTASSVQLANDLFAPLGMVALQAGGGGGTEEDAPTRFVDGGAIGVQLIRGDMSATGLGTVTRVEGDKLVAFGHPMMNGGVTALPTAVGKVLWFLASQSRSFKIGMPVRSVGSLVNDRQASIVVSHSVTAPTVEVSVHIRGTPGAPFTDWNFEIAHEKFMVPSLLAVAIGNAIQATSADRQDVSWSAKSRLQFKDVGMLEVEDFGVSVGGTPDDQEFVRSNMVSAVGAVLNNPWEDAFVEKIDIDIDLRYAREIYKLQGVEVLDPEPEPGGEARLRLTLLPFAGKPVERILKLPIPSHLAGEKLKVEIRPGYLVEKPKGSPESLSELVAAFEDPVYPAKSVVLSYETGGGLTHHSQVALNLPPGAVDAVASSSSSLAPVALKSERHQVTELPRFMVGRETVTLQIKSKTH